MFAYAFDRPSHSTVVVVISPDPTLAYALSILRLRNHNTVVVIAPTGSKPDLLLQASLSFDWNEEIVQESETLSQGVAKCMSKLGISKERSPEDIIVDDRSPSSPSPAPDRSPPTTRDDVILEDYFPVDSNSPWHVPPEKTSKKEEMSAPCSYPPTPETVNAQCTPKELRGEPISQIPSSSKSPFGDSVSLKLPTQPSLKQLKKRIPVGFRPLVEILYTMRGEGYDRPLRSSVGLQLIQKDPAVYERVGNGYTRFTQYASMAVSLEIAELGGRDGKAWISFHPSFYQT